MQKTLFAKISKLSTKTKIIACISIVLILGGVIAALIVASSQSSAPPPDYTQNEDGSITTADNSQTLSPPAHTTEELIYEHENIAARALSSDKIEFIDDIAVVSGEVIAVWVYSEPKFLGFFEVKEADGVKYIEGLAAALAKLTVEPGVHNVAIVTSNGAPVGYIDIFIADDGKIKSDDPADSITEKTETIEEIVPFASKAENEANMLRGTTKIVQTGKNGIKKVTYTVKYDQSGIELSRTKLSEAISKQPVEQITKIGTSDYNINADMITDVSGGPMCLSSEFSNDMGCVLYEPTNKSFLTFTIKGKTYLFCAADDDRCFPATGTNAVPVTINPAIAIKVTETAGTMVGETTYAGKLYKLDFRIGTDDLPPLTDATCAKYGLACGRW